MRKRKSGDSGGHGADGDLPRAPEELERRNASLEHLLREQQDGRAATLHMLEDLERERRQIEQARREWVAAIDAVRDPIFIHDKELKIVRANRAYAERAGLDIREVIGKPYWQMFPKLASPPPGCACSLKQSWGTEEELRLPSGEAFVSRAYPIDDVEGQHLYSLHVLTDVTEKRKAEIEQHILSEAMRQMTEAVLVLDRDMRITYLNPAFYRLFGYDPGEILGQPIAVLSVPGQADELQPPEIVRQLRETKQWRGEVRCRAKDGTAIPVLLSAAAIDDDRGEIAGYVGTFLDLREIRRAEQGLRESEEKFRSIGVAAVDAVLMLDEDGRIAYWNPAAERIFGYTPEQALGQDMHLLLAPQRYLADSRRGWAHFRATGEGPLIGKVREIEARRRDGKEFPVELSVSALRFKERWYAVGILRDISARKQAEAELRLFRTLLDNSNDAVEVIEADTLRFLDVNEKECRDLGYSREELLSMSVPDIDPALGSASMKIVDEQIQKSGAALFESFHRRKDGSTFPVEISLKLVEIGEKTYVLSIARDITERKRAEERLRASEEQYRLLFESSHVALMLLAPPSWKFTGANQATLQLFGASSVAEFTALGPWDISPERQPDGRLSNEKAPDMIAIAMREGSHFFEWEHQRLDGQPFDADVLLTRVGSGEDVFLQATVRDISERKRAEQALLRSQAGLAEAQRLAHLGNFEVDLAARTATYSDEYYRIFGLEPGEPLASFESTLQYVHPDDVAMVRGAGEHAVSAHVPFSIEHRIRRKDGVERVVHVRTMFMFDDDHRAIRMLGTVQDITERKQAEESLHRANRALKTLSACNTALVHAQGEPALLQEICRVIVETGGYAYAWIGYAERDEARRIKPMAQMGFENGFLDKLPFTWSETERGRGPSGTAIREGMAVVTRDAAGDPSLSVWRDEIMRLGIGSGCALPLISDDETFGVLTMYSRERGAFDKDELTLLAELADDLNFGILTLRTRTAHEHLQEAHLKSAARLRETLIDTIRAVALTVEKRDPYTAGHQNKVAQLCAAIGRELGMDEDRLEGLRLGATIHDIGKVYIPAEILNRPGKLSAAEFEMIKSHPEVGYDIIKGIKFPWPVGQIIMQHHERLDGSGYPKGLKGDEIILEARILAVADTVEAMMSHRPYRPGLGLDAALAQIQEKRDTWYDPAATDACVRLFRERDFRFE